jgi:general secretion pathway protein D
MFVHLMVTPLKLHTALMAFFLLCIQSVAMANERINLNMRNADVVAALEWYADIADKPIIIDPRVRGTITILSNAELSLQQASEVFLSALTLYGFAVIENQGTLRIVPGNLAPSSPVEVLEGFNANSQQQLYVLAPSNLSAELLAQKLQPLVNQSGSLLALKESNLLLISDAGNHIKRLVTLIERLDQQGQLAIAAMRIKHASAEKLVGLIESLLPQAKQQGFVVVSDQRTNSLLMTGSATLQQRVEDLVNQLDQPLAKGQQTQVIYLEYADAAELGPILAAMRGQLSDGATNNISISVSETANALIVTAPPAALNELNAVIQGLDIRRQQVLVEAIIVEVNDDVAKLMGVEWRTSLSASDGLEALTQLGLTSDSSDGFAGEGLTLGFFRNGSLRAVLRALENQADTNILSTPSLLTLDNQQAEILVGSNVPFITGQSTSSSSTEDPFTTIARQDIGLKLKVTPQINQAGTVTLDVEQELETLTESTQASDLITSKRSIKTKVLVDDNSILVLGGLISDEQTERVTKVPLLGDMPYIGALFRTTESLVTKKNLMVFIHPQVIDDDKAKQISKQRFNDMHQRRKTYFELRADG